MSFLRPLSKLRPSTVAAAASIRTSLTPSAAAPPLSLRPRQQIRFATQDYGSGDGDPAAEDPMAQGKRGREDLEHPGPPPPKVAQKDSKETSSSSSGSSASKGSEEKKKKKNSASGADKSSSSSSSKHQGAQPKILNENPPTTENQSEDVRKHNEDMANRAEKAHEQVSNEDAEKDKVGKDFWKG